MVLVCRVISQDCVTKDLVTLWVGTLMLRHHSRNFCCQKDCGSGNITFSLPRNRTRPRDQRAMYLYEWEHLIKSQHHKFGRHRDYGSVDVLALVCHVTP